MKLINTDRKKSKDTDTHNSLGNLETAYSKTQLWVLLSK